MPETCVSESPTHTHTHTLPFPARTLSASEFVGAVESLLHRPMLVPQERHLKFLNTCTEKGTLAKACEILTHTHTQSVGIVVGCPANVSHMPPTDLDGLVGAAALAHTLIKMQKKKVVLLSAAINHQALHQLLTYYPHFRGMCFEPFDWDDVGVPGKPLDHTKQIELRTFVPPTGWDEDWDAHSRDVYSQLDAIVVVNYPGISQKGSFTNWRGLSMHHYIARFERYLRWAQRDKKNTISFCVSGNELGCKCVCEKVFENCLNGAAYATESESDVVIVGHTSNLIAYALIACIAASCNEVSSVIEDTLMDETHEEIVTSKLLQIGVDDAQGYFESLSNVGEVCVDPSNAYGRKKTIRGLHISDIFDVKFKIAKFAAMAKIIDKEKIIAV